MTATEVQEMAAYPQEFPSYFGQNFMLNILPRQF